MKNTKWFFITLVILLLVFSCAQKQKADEKKKRETKTGAERVPREAIRPATYGEPCGLSPCVEGLACTPVGEKDGKEGGSVCLPIA